MANADRLIDIFNEAKNRTPGLDRERFLDESCQDAFELREQVVSLLEASEGAGNFLKMAVFSPTVQNAEPLGSMIDRYKLLEVIGEGGGGVVYVAEQEVPVRRRVALKVIKLGMDTKSVVARFEAERQALAMMDHPNIAKVLDAGTTNTGRPYFVMELVRGIKITDFCDQNQLTTHERLDLFIQVCRAIQHAHQKGIIHRDIKPSNTLVTLHDGRPVPKVIDFGVAKAMEGRLTDATIYTQLHQFIGTPAYMSPEQAQMSGLDVDTRSDIYSLGVLLYELLTGRTPFNAQELLESGLDVLRKTIQEKEPPRPSARLTHLNGEELTRTAHFRGADAPQLIHLVKGDLDWIVMKCLEKDRTRRYETANGLAVDLEHYLNNEPVIARPPSVGYILRKALHRNKLAFAAVAGIVASLLIGLLASLWQTGEAIQARKSTQRQLYVAKMNLARQAWDENNVGRVRQLLADTANEPDRGFEWYYWQRQSHLELKTLYGHLGSVAAVAFSPDGSRILTGSFDRTAILWDADRGTELLTLKGHGGAIRSVCFSADGKRMATASEDQTAQIWEAATGAPLFTLRGHSGALMAVAFSRDGRHLVTASRDRTARVWNAADGRWMFSLEHSNQVWTAAFSTDGRQVLTSTGDEEALVWDVPARALRLRLKAPTAQMGIEKSEFASPLPLTAAFSPDERRIVTGSHNQTAIVWDAGTGSNLFSLVRNAHLRSPRQSDIPFSVAFSMDGQRLITGGLDQSVLLWSLAGKTSVFTIKGHEAEITAVAFSPDRTRIVTGSADRTAKIWDAADSKETRGLVRHDSIVVSATFSEDNQQILTASWDGTAKVWDAASGSVLLTLRGSSPAWTAAFSRDRRRIVTGSDDGSVTVWDALSGAVLLALPGHTADVIVAVFSPDGQRILTSGDDAMTRVWDAATGQILLTMGPHPFRYAEAAAFSPDGRRIVTACQDADPATQEEGSVTIWDANSGERLLVFPGHTGGVSSVVYSHDGRFILTGSMDRTAKVWDAANGRLLHTLTGHRDQVIKLAFSSDDRRIVTGGFDYTTRVWDTASGQELLNIKGHLMLALSPDGTQIVTGGILPPRVLEVASPDQVQRWSQEEGMAARKMDERRKQAMNAQHVPERTLP